MFYVSVGRFIKRGLEDAEMSQGELALRLGITKGHLNRIINEKKELDLNIAIMISLILDVDYDLLMKVQSTNKIKRSIMNDFTNEKAMESFIKKNKVDESVEKKWFVYTYDDPLQKMHDIYKYMGFGELANVDKYLDNVVFKNKEDNKIPIVLWLQRCKNLALEQEVEKYNSKNMKQIIEELQKEVLKEEFNIERITKLLNNNGIYFVVEEGLSIMKVRGAFKVFPSGKPAIFLTGKEETVKDKFLSLFHELAHCKTDYNFAKANYLMENNDEMERKADETALKWLNECYVK